MRTGSGRIRSGDIRCLVALWVRWKSEPSVTCANHTTENLKDGWIFSIHFVLTAKNKPQAKFTNYEEI